MRAKLLLAGALILGAVWSCRAQIAPVLKPATEPVSDALWTSTREVRSLAYDPKTSELWAATAGGVVRTDAGRTESWSPGKWTRRTGLPANEALEIGLENGEVKARFPLHSAIWGGKSWGVSPAPPFQKTNVEALWRGERVRATLDSLEIGDRKIALPPSSGTHISALLRDGKSLLAALYGDGLWRFDGQKWTPDARNAALPDEAREITALAGQDNKIFIGTRRAGTWASFEGAAWRATSAGFGAEPFNANIQNFALFRGILWASTLDDGLIYRSGESWKHVASPELSSSAPRQMLSFQNQLFVRHGGGLVDSFDGRFWTKNAFKTIPRKGVYALAGDEKTLFAAGWGGWSEWDGRNWTPHFEIPELQGVPLMGLFLQGDNLWIATQSRGLGLYHRSAKDFRWFDERDGLPDDWITALGSAGGKIYAGTFVGGLARLDGAKWHVFEALRGQNVTAIAEMGGKVWVSTRAGIWEIVGDNATKTLKPWLDSEVQALFAGETGVWVGARTSLSWLKSAR